MPPSLCTVSLPTTTNPPEPAICHPSSFADIRDTDPGCTVAMKRFAIALRCAPGDRESGE